MFKSTRSNITVSASVAIIQGIASDGGLFVPECIPELKINNDLLNISYQDLSFKILRLYLDDYTDEEIHYCITHAYNQTNFKEKLVGIKDFDKFGFLTLYHGPTLAFKDMALTILPHLLETALKKHHDDKKTLILTATSGDTGSACMSGFSNSNIKTLVLYPNNGVSPLQERQMHAFYQNGSCCLAVNGNFDDCQNLVKQAFLEIKDDKLNLASANSINVGRLIPQIVYYFYAYLQLVNKKRIKLGDEINVSVPTGNFGNILAGYLAKKMGLPVNKLLCASNQNDVLTEFFNTGVYNKNRPFYQTLSPSMDILVSSNLERYLYLISNGNFGLISELMNKLKSIGYYALPEDLKAKLNEFIGYACNDEEIKKYILKCYEEHQFLIDPHTACGYGCYCKNNDDVYTIVVSTASPFKFPKAYYDLFDIKSNDIFSELENLAKKTNTPFDNKIKELKKVVINRKYLDINEYSIKEIHQIINNLK